jgi:hypothetical protein
LGGFWRFFQNDGGSQAPKGKQNHKAKSLTWKEIKEAAFGEMGIMPNDWELLSPEYFMIRLSGLRNAQTSIYRQEWERSRWTAFILLSPHIKKNAKMSPQNLITFPWESDQEESIAEFVAKRKDLYAKLVP